jgi:hypothetical protein
MPDPAPVPAFVTQQLRCGAYWDAVPPFYAVNGLPPIPTSNYEKNLTASYYDFVFNKYEASDPSKTLMPIIMPKSLALKLLWQVRSVTLKIEYENKTLNSDGFELNLYRAKSNNDPEYSYIETSGPFKLTDSALDALISSEKWATRDLKLPQGNIEIRSIYPENRDQARNQERTNLGIVYHFNSSDYANYNTEKQNVIQAVDLEASKVASRINLMKSYADASNYKVLSNELERQLTSFPDGISKLKTSLQQTMTAIEEEYQKDVAGEYDDEGNEIKAPMPVELANNLYGKYLQKLANSGTNAVNEEAALQFFDWNKGFSNQISFYSIKNFLTTRHNCTHRPPTIGGMFSGLFQAPDGKSCVAVIRLPPSAVIAAESAETENYFVANKKINYKVKTLSKTDENSFEQEIDVESEIGFNSLLYYSSFSSFANYAGAIKFEGAGQGNLRSGSVSINEQNRNVNLYGFTVNYFDLINRYNENKLTQQPEFPTKYQEEKDQIELLTQEEKDILLSGPYFSSGDWENATNEFDSAANKLSQLKEISETEEKGKIQFKDKNDNLLYETPLYGKRLIPVKNFKLTIKIYELNADPITETSPEEPV